MDAKERATKLVCETIYKKWRTLNIEGWDEDEAISLVAAALESARAEALEDAARVAEGFESIPSDRMNYGDYIAAAIRELAKG